MERRRSLGGFFKFFIEPTELNFAYGKQKTLTNENWLLEVGTINGSYSTVTRKSSITQKNESYWKLEGRGSGLETVAFINFKTYKANQVVQLAAFDECNSPNDFLAIGKLDSLDRSPLQAKLNNSTEQTISFTVPTAGSHFIKVYYYQHNDADTASYSVTTHTTHAGYIRFVSYYNQYPYGYDKPDTQQLFIKSYTGWILVSKPDWVNLDKTYDRSGKKYLTVECQGNPGAARTGNLVLKEKRKDSQITVTINQAANPHPNDIILSIDKTGGLVNENGKTVDINVKLIGETSYTISNVSSNYSVTKSSDGTKITVKNNTANNLGQQNASFKVIGNNGTVKDIILKEDYADDINIECYCNCNAKDACGCDVEDLYNKQKISCSGCNNGYESCFADDGTCQSHQSVLCTCYGSVGCSGCHSGKSNEVCTCKNAVSCTGCKSGNTASSCSCNGSQSCTGCHSGNTSGSCSCNGSQACSGCNSGHTSGSCSCNGSQACSNCYSGYTESSCSCNSSHSCSGCHSGNTTTNCNDKNNRTWDSKFYIKLTISTSLWSYNTTHYALFKIVKNDVTHWIFVAQELPINSERSVALPYNVLGGYIKQVKFYFDGQGTESYIVSDISKQVLQNYPVSISVVSSNRFGVFNRYTDTDIMANNGGNWCSGYEYSSCSCNGSQTCSGCNSGNTAASCSCNGSQACSGCNSGNTSGSCSCNGSQSCTGCHSGNTSGSCSCNGSQSCTGCNSGHTASSCTCNGSVGCSGCKSGYTASKCTCNNIYACSGCHSGHNWGTCSCYNSKSCSGCHSGHTASSCTCNGSVGCPGCHSGYGASSCTCNSTYACTGCHSGKTNASCSCNNSVSCSGCHSGHTSSSCSCYNGYSCSGCNSGHTAGSCSCNNSQSCSGCNSGNTASSCSCNGTKSCSGCYSGNTTLSNISQSFIIESAQIIDVPWYFTGMVLRIGPFIIYDDTTWDVNSTTQYIDITLPGCCAGRQVDSVTIYNNPNATKNGRKVNFTSMQVTSSSGGLKGISNANNTVGDDDNIILNFRKSTKGTETRPNTVWCDGDSSVQCSCNNSQSCSGCNSGNTAASCSCNGTKSCSGCHSGNTSSSCSCNGTKSCSGCNSGNTSSSCSCNGSQSCTGCKSGNSGSACTCNGSQTCSNCNSGHTASKCTCQGSVSCPGCHSGHTSSSCSCNGAVGCTGCDTAYTEYTCTCNSKVFHPHCDCHQYCPCEGYVIPVVN